MFIHRFFLILTITSSTAKGYEEPNTEDNNRLFPLEERFTIPMEKHEVVTDDGYILTLFRIYGGDNISSKNRKPILMMHGMFGMSDNFVAAELYAKSMGGYFSTHGYDVWLGNNRGTRLSRRHLKLDPNNKDFWQFSWHELGVNDLPAMIDYILETTGKRKLYYIGHSQGGGILFVLTSLKPKYQEKIAQASLLAPSGYMNHFANPLLLTLARNYKMLADFAEIMNIFELPPPWMKFSEVLTGFCTDQTLKDSCIYLLSILSGGTSGEINKVQKWLPELFSMLSTISIHQVMHYAQNIFSGRFRQYDYGEKENLLTYGTPEPPDYPIENIQIPIAVYSSEGDMNAFRKDIEALCDKLPKCTRKFRMRNPKWTHIDFIISTNLLKELIEPVIEYMNTFDNTSEYSNLQQPSR